MLKNAVKNWLDVGSKVYKKKEATGNVIFDSTEYSKKFNEYEAIGTYSDNCWVGSCVLLRGNTFADTEFFLENSKQEKIVDHPLLDVIRNPGNSVTGFDLLRITSFHIDLCGNAFWYYPKVQDKVENIQILQPDKVKVIIDANKGIIGYEIDVSGKRKILDPENVTHFSSPNPNNLLRGVSPIFSVKYQVDTDKHSNIWNYLFFKNGASSGTILESDKPVLDAVKQRIVNTFSSMHKGTKNSHKTAFLDGGIRINNSGKNHKDMEFKELQLTNRDKILAAFQVPKILIGQFEGGSLAEAQTAKDIFSENVIDPLLRSFVEIINMDLLPLYDSERSLRLKFTSKIKGDQEFEEKKKNEGMNVWITVNERRSREGLEPVEGGDVLRQPINLVPINFDTGVLNDEEQSDTKNISKKGLIDRVLTKQFKNNYAEKYLVNHQVYESNMKKRLINTFNKQQKETLRLLQQSKSYIVTKSLTDDVFNYKKNTELFIKLFTPFISDVYTSSANDQSEIFNLGVSLTTDTVGVQNEVNRMTLKFSQQVNTTTQKRLRNQLNEGIAEGEGIPDLSKRVKTIFTEAKTSRTNNIARTEITKATNAGALKSYEVSKVVDEKEWLATGGARDSHASASGQIKPIKEAFDVGGEKLEHPGDSSGSPENVCNCRCTVLPVIK